MLIARALMVDPKIMILDEPLSGVDEESRKSITDLLIQLTREKNIAVFFSSHDLEMVQRVADGIVRVDHGQIQLEERKARLQP
jgi:ABC-type multidrug transport system ATPase subunit